MLTLPRLALATAVAVLPLAAAQGPPGAQGGGGGGPPGGAPVPGPEDKPGDENMPGYPQWVTNDYPCVIECCQGFNGADQNRERNGELEKTTRECVVDKCNKDSEPLNLYQMTYIVEMFYDTGSIYECDGKPCKPDGEAPTNAPTVPPSGQGGVTSDGSASGAATGDHTATPAVSIPPVSNGETAAGGADSTVVETATAGATDGAESSAPAGEVEGDGSGNGAMRAEGGWGVGVGVALAAVGVALGAGVIV